MYFHSKHRFSNGEGSNLKISTNVLQFYIKICIFAPLFKTLNNNDLLNTQCVSKEEKRLTWTRVMLEPTASSTFSA
jgi:hypothetical protein